MLRYIKYGIAILVIGLVIHATNPWVGLPLMAELWSFLATYRGEVRIALIGTAIVLLGLALFVGRSWCRYLCPFGGWISVFNKYSLLKRGRGAGRCVSCDLCRQRCSGGLNPMGSQRTWRSLECVRCLQCYTACQAKVCKLHWRGEERKMRLMKGDTKRWKSGLRRGIEVVALVSFIVIGGTIVWQGLPFSPGPPSPPVGDEVLTEARYYVKMGGRDSSGPALLQKVHYSVLENHIENGRCKFCGEQIPGVWS